MPLSKYLLFFLCSLFLSLPTHALSSVTFHSIEQGRKAIVDETFEPYFSRLQSMEMRAKTAGKVKEDKLKKMRNNTRRIYQQAVMAFSTEDKATLTWYINHYSKLLNKSYPLLAKTPWKFVKLDNYIEGALPHTRGDTIVLHEAMLNGLTQAKSIQGEQALQGIGTVLLHELVHVAQRQKVSVFHNLYKQWGFRKVNVNSINAWLKEHQLINPDGVRVEWIFPVNNGDKRHWILPVVTWNEGNTLRHMPADFRMRAISMHEIKGKWEIITSNNHRPVMDNLMSQVSLRRAFPRVNGLYHPNEISADMIVNIFVFDNYVDHSTLQADSVAAWEKVFAPVRQVLVK